MSIWRNLTVECPPGAGVPATVSDMISNLRYTFTIANEPACRTTDLNWMKACVQELPEDDDSDMAVDFTGREVLLDD